MKTRFYHLLALAICALPLGTARPAFASDIVVYVAPNGDDSRRGSSPDFNSRSKDGPVSTLARARELIREARKAGGGPRARMLLRGGRYYLGATLELDDTDSGMQDAPTIIAAFGRERPVLLGAYKVDKFVAFRGDILSADLDPQVLDGRRMRQLFIDGEAQTLARYPNIDRSRPVSGGWSYADGEIVSSQVARAGDSKRTLVVRPQDLRVWTAVEGAEVMVFPRYNWVNDIAPVESFDDQSHVLRLKSDVSYEIRPGDRYFVQNLLSELDTPGEWFQDSRQGRLYFWPPRPISDKSTVEVSRLESLIVITKAHHIEIRGLELAIAEGSAIRLIDSSNCNISANLIHHAGLSGRGTHAISVARGRANRVIGNDISNVGGSAILLRGGDGDTLTSSESVIENNYLHHTGEVYKQGVAIELQGVGHVVRNNLIHDTPRMAILAMGNDHLIELNRIHHTNLETADTGAIYATGRNWLDSRGLVIRYNEILDSVGFGFDFTEKKWKSPHFAFGIYLDDNASGVDIIGNVIGRSSWAAVMIHGGSYNQVRNNIFFDSGLSQAYFMTLGPNNPFMKTGAQKHAEFATKTAWKKYRGFADVQPDEVKSMADTVFERNVVAYSGAASNYVLTRGLPIDSSRIDRNLLLRRESDIKIDDGSKAGLSWEQWKALGLDSNSVVSDATLAAAANGWRTFASTALARRIGFVQIPFAKIGPYKSPERVTWPIVEAPTIHETLH